MNAETRVGIGYDLHRLVPDRVLRLGTVEIPSPLGLEGHSDGDVVAHAVADALLGAASLGEIGIHFPPGDSRWEGVRGGTILSAVAGLLVSAGWIVGNVDAVVIAERPRLAAHRETMIAGIADALKVDPHRVSVKIKSNEESDAVGRGEAIAAHAVALIRRIA